MVTPTLKSALAGACEVLETSAGYALVAVAIYAVIFIDITGGGCLWDTVGHLRASSQEEVESADAIRVIKVHTPAVADKVSEDRILAVFDAAPPEGAVAAVYQAPDALMRPSERPAAAFTDVPADPKSGKAWKIGLQSELRHFTVYGRGEQTTSVSKSGGGVSVRAANAPATGLAARAKTEPVARPGVGSRLSSGALSASGASRNAR